MQTEREVQGRWRVGLAVADGGLRFPAVVVTVVKEENNLPANFRLQPAGCDEFRIKKPPREKSTGLLAETDDRGRHQEEAGKKDAFMGFAARVFPRHLVRSAEERLG